jgi:DNA repair protein RecO (recombination protein O)
MSGTYTATGINLKTMPLGETDRLLTVLTQEYGLVRVVAPGARKHQSSLRGRSDLFAVNQLLIAKGKSLDKIVQVESVVSYPGLGADLGKLTASQYLAELVLYQALSDQPQVELFGLFNQQLRHLEQLPKSSTLASLVQAIFQLLAQAGVEPQVQACCMTQQLLNPDFTTPDWQVGFSAAAGGTVILAELDQLAATHASVPKSPPKLRVKSAELAKQYLADSTLATPRTNRVAEANDRRSASVPVSKTKSKDAMGDRLNAVELTVLQHLAESDLLDADGTLNSPVLRSLPITEQVWLSMERILRHYAQYHFDRPIRSAALIETSFLSLPLSISP